MSINILPATPETLALLKGQKCSLHDGEGLVYIKLVMVRPETMENGDPGKLIDEAPGVIVCGQLQSVKDQLNKWFDAATKEYAK